MSAPLLSVRGGALTQHPWEQPARRGAASPRSVPRSVFRLFSGEGRGEVLGLSLEGLLVPGEVGLQPVTREGTWGGQEPGAAKDWGQEVRAGRVSVGWCNQGRLPGGGGRARLDREAGTWSGAECGIDCCLYPCLLGPGLFASLVRE